MDLVTMAEVVSHLGLPNGDTTYAVELQRYINAATPIVEYITGPLNSVTYTDEIYQVRDVSQIMLRHTPVLTVDLVTEYVSGTMGFVLTPYVPITGVGTYSYRLDNAEAGLLVRYTSGYVSNFFGTTVEVNYTAGRTSIPAQLKLAALEDIRGLFQQSRMGGRPQFGGGMQGGDDVWTVGPMHLFPRLAALMVSAQRVPGIA